MFKTRFDKWLDDYEWELAIAFDNQTEHDSFNAFIESQYQLMLENEREAACDAHDRLLGFNVTKWSTK